jgi:hypothetical protein
VHHSPDRQKRTISRSVLRSLVFRGERLLRYEVDPNGLCGTLVCHRLSKEVGEAEIIHQSGPVIEPGGSAVMAHTDRRWVYSAGCSWHGPISEAERTKDEIGLPCCPFCGSVLFQIGSEEEWWRGAREHDARGHSNYVALLTWHLPQKRCWPSLRAAAVAFQQETGLEVRWHL